MPSVINGGQAILTSAFWAVCNCSGLGAKLKIKSSRIESNLDKNRWDTSQQSKRYFIHESKNLTNTRTMITDMEISKKISRNKNVCNATKLRLAYDFYFNLFRVSFHKLLIVKGRNIINVKESQIEHGWMGYPPFVHQNTL